MLLTVTGMRYHSQAHCGWCWGKRSFHQAAAVLWLLGGSPSPKRRVRGPSRSGSWAASAQPSLLCCPGAEEATLLWRGNQGGAAKGLGTLAFLFGLLFSSSSFLTTYWRPVGHKGLWNICTFMEQYGRALRPSADSTMLAVTVNQNCF